MTILGIIRNGHAHLAVRRNEHIQANDILIVEGKLDKILTVRQRQGVQIESELIHEQEVELKSREVGVAEVLLDVDSNLAGQSIRQLRFREKYRLTVLALRRRGEAISGALADEPLRSGDVMLVQGLWKHMDLLRCDSNFLLLEPVHLHTRRTHKAPKAVAILVMMMLVATLGLLHISVAAVIAATVMVISGILNIDEAYQSIDWQSVVLIAGMLPLGMAMESSNAAKYLADFIIELLMAWGPLAILLGIYLLTGIMTQAMSNAATTVLMAPIAINIALELGADPRSFLMTVVVGASTSFLTPIAHQSNILVFGPGGYKFTDFTKVGLGLTLLYLVLIGIAMPMIWPLFP